MTRRILRIALFALLLLVAAVVLVGGGFGTKGDHNRIHTIDTVYFAHRAGAVVFPENCLEGVHRADSLGYTGVELDIHETSDHRFVLIHDDSCRRLLGLPGLVSEHTLAELRAVPLRLNEVPTACHIATLDTVLGAFGDRLLFYLDCKITSPAQAERLAGLIERHGHVENVLIASSSIPFLTTLEYRHPQLTTVLEGFDKGEEWTYALFPKKFRPDLLSSFSFETDSDQVAWLKAHDLLRDKIVYGLDSAAFARAQRLGITRFIVDEGVPRIGP